MIIQWKLHGMTNPSVRKKHTCSVKKLKKNLSAYFNVKVVLVTNRPTRTFKTLVFCSDHDQYLVLALNYIFPTRP